MPLALRACINEAPVPIAMFDCEMRYLAASRHWIENICHCDANVIGQLHYDVVPEVPQRWKDNHRRALEGETLRNSADPFRRRDGRTQWLRWEMRPWRDAAGVVRGIVIFAEDITSKIELERALQESEQRLSLAVTGSGMAMFDRDIITGAYFWNDEWYRLFGYQIGEVEPDYAAWLARVHPEDRQAAKAAIVDAVREHKEYFSEYRIVRPNGTVRWVRAQGRFLYHGDKAVRITGLAQDVTDERRRAEVQRVLVHELQHRTRNLITVVRSIAEQTLAAGGSPENLAHFDQRLQALSRVQGLLSRPEDAPINLGELIVMELEALGSGAFADKIVIAGPEVPLQRSAVEMLSLAIHELLTNAVKYGALLTGTGRLSVTWRVEETPPDRRLVLEWIERGVAPCVSGRNGYGRMLIEEALPYSLGARTRFDLGTDGLSCSIDLPLSMNGAGSAVE